MGKGDKHDRQFGQMIEAAMRWGKPVRIGVNWGSLDQELLAQLMDENSAPRRALGRQVGDVRGAGHLGHRFRQACAEEMGMDGSQIILSCKVSGVQDLISVYRELAARCDYPLHLGLTEAGMGTKGTVASSVALGILLQEGIGDTIRVSLTPQPGESRTQEVVIASEILQALGLRSFVPSVTACPGCGRTTSTTFQELAKQIDDYLRAQMPVWRAKYPGRREDEGRGDGLHRQRAGREQARRHRHQPARHRRSAGRAGLHRRRRRRMTLRGDNIANEFHQIVENYIEKRFGQRMPPNRPEHP